MVSTFQKTYFKQAIFKRFWANFYLEIKAQMYEVHLLNHILTNRIQAKPKADSVNVPKNNNHIGDEISTVK